MFLCLSIQNTGLKETFLNIRITLGLKLKLEVMLAPLPDQLHWLLITIVLQPPPIMVRPEYLRDELGLLVLHLGPILVVAKEIHI